MSVFVNISGTAFSLLLYENLRSEYDQEGFLLGEIVTNEKRTITDNDQEVVTIEHAIKIDSVLPCPRRAHFYNNAGIIDTKKMEAFIQDKKDSVVSWFSFKRTPSLKLFLREKIVMKQLAMYFMPTAPERFTCCLLNHQRGSDLGATHIFSQRFIRYSKSAYQPVPMHIINLNDPHDVYKNPETSSPLFLSMIEGLNLNMNAKGYETIDSIEVALDQEIAETVEKLAQSEKEMHELELRIAELRKKVNGDANGNIEIETLNFESNNRETVASPSKRDENLEIPEEQVLRRSARRKT